MLDVSNNEIRKTVSYVSKRDGSTENFDRNKIATAVSKAMRSVGIKSKTIPEEVSLEVTDKLPFT